MSRCYCYDISLINSDIATLQAMVEVLGKVSDRNSLKDTQLSQLATHTKDALHPANVSTLTLKINQLNRDVATNTADAIASINSEISNLESKRNSFNIEDAEYHRIQAQKRRS